MVLQTIASAARPTGCEIKVRTQACAYVRVVSLNRPVRQDRTKSAITAGAVVSKPTLSIMPRTFDSARVKPLEALPRTTAFEFSTSPFGLLIAVIRG